MLVATFAFISCGGGGGGTTPTPTTQPTSAVVKLSTQGTLTVGTLIGGIDIKVDFPSGVTAQSTTNPPREAMGSGL
jgi:hypothetical protein